MRRRLPSSSQRKLLLPILDDLHEAAINCRYGEAHASDNLTELINQLTALLCDNVEDKLVLYAFGARLLALMIEKRDALLQVENAAKRGLSMWGVLSLLPSTDVVAPPVQRARSHPMHVWLRCSVALVAQL